MFTSTTYVDNLVKTSLSSKTVPVAVMSTTLSQSISNSELSLNNLPNSSENTLPNSINPKEKISKSRNRFFKIISDYFQYLKTVLIAILISGLKASGPIPKHVAIIMDGNRRYAKKKGFSHVSEGHFEGAKTLEKVIGITNVSLYFTRFSY